MRFAVALNDETIELVANHLKLGNQIHKTAPEIVEELDRIAVEKLIPNYLAQCEKAGVDGQTILDYALQMVEESKSVYGDEYNWVK